jgi:hypothetical protein
MAYASVTYTSASGTTFALTNSNGDPIPYIRKADIKVYVNTVLQTLTTDYTFNTAGTAIVLNTPVSGATVLLQRITDIADPTVVYTAGSTLTAQDLNNADNQLRYGLQEFQDSVNAGGGVPDGDKGDISVGGNGTLWSIDAGAVTETKIGSGAVTETKIGSGAVTSAKILDGTIVNADINASASIDYSKLNLTGSVVNADISASAEIAVSKLADGAARQLLQTDAAGTGVEWTDNVDIPGTLDVTGNTTLDGNLTVGGSFDVTSLNGGPLAGARNRIINGDMRIDQRNAGASVSITTAGNYTVDRWSGNATQNSKYTVQQDTSNPAGFANSLKVTSSSSYSVTSSDVFWLAQAIEGLNTSDLAWGTASAKSATLSFWVQSSLTGTFGGALRNSAANRSYPFTYTISSANTWEYKTVSIPSDTSGSWLSTNGIGINLNFGLGVGSTFSGTAGAWASANYVSATGATSVVGTNGATFYITGVQLEPGTVATPFERRSYGQELALCQRYCVVYRGNAGANDFAGIGTGTMSATTTAIIYVPTPVPLRASPTYSYSGTLTISDGVIGANVSALGTQYMASPGGAWLTVTTVGGQTAGRGAFLYTQNATTNFFTLASEL